MNTIHQLRLSYGWWQNMCDRRTDRQMSYGLWQNMCDGGMDGWLDGKTDEM